MSGHKMSGHEPERSCASSSIDELLENSAAYAAEFAGPSTHVPSKAVARPAPAAALDRRSQEHDSPRRGGQEYVPLAYIAIGKRSKEGSIVCPNEVPMTR
jgi:hypothetical protein